MTSARAFVCMAQCIVSADAKEPFSKNLFDGDLTVISPIQTGHGIC
jgi:hypothetical protein